MKKFTILSMALLFGLAGYADEVKILSLSGKEIPGAPADMHIGLCGLAISPNGKYVCGALENAAGIFISDWQNDETSWMIANADDGGELRNVNNEGIAIGIDGPGITYSFETGKETELTFTGVKYIVGSAITNDGGVLAGSLVTQGFETHAAFKKEGADWERLPIPADDEIDPFFTKFTKIGSGAQWISGDGKVIAGFIGSFAVPFLWVMNDEGVYEPDFFIQRYMKADVNDQDPDKVFWGTTAMYGLNLSNNGKYVCFIGSVGASPEESHIVPMVYNVQTKDLTVYDEEQPVDTYGYSLYPTAIANDGTFIGSIGQTVVNTSGSFIMEAGETVAKDYKDVFPNFNEALGEGLSYGFGVPTGISANSRYLTGYTYYADDYYDENSDAYYATYIIDRGEEYEVSGVGEIASEIMDAKPVGIYTPDGKQVKTPVKGINIVRMSDGSARKVMIR